MYFFAHPYNVLAEFIRPLILSRKAYPVLLGVVLLVLGQNAWSQAFDDFSIEVRGLIKNSAVIEINGKQRVLKVGKRNADGLLLVSADSKKAVLELGGVKRQFYLSQRAGGRYLAPERQEVRISSSRGGHYRVRGLINNSAVNFLVDTGATVISMDKRFAQRMGVSLANAKPVSLHTANGITKGYKVLLRSVTVGGINMRNVEAVVSEGNQGGEILLGNSFLSRVNMTVDSGIMVLQSRL